MVLWPGAFESSGGNKLARKLHGPWRTAKGDPHAAGDQYA